MKSLVYWLSERPARAIVAIAGGLILAGHAARGSVRAAAGRGSRDHAATSPEPYGAGSEPGSGPDGGPR